jgi:hypothetical protein
MKKENIIKAALIFGGGYLLFLLAKTAKEKNTTPRTNTKTSNETVKSFDSVVPDDAPAPSVDKAPIVMEAYIMAMEAGESPMRLTELNKECMKDFGMRCHVSEDGKVVVCDIKGNTILSQ